MVNERNELREQCRKNEQWIKDSENEHKKVFSELLSTFNIQSEKLKKITAGECKWQDKYDDLKICNNRAINDMNSAKLNENRLQSMFDECERNKKCLEEELLCAKVNYLNFII